MSWQLKLAELAGQLPSQPVCFEVEIWNSELPFDINHSSYVWPMTMPLRLFFHDANIQKARGAS